MKNSILLTLGLTSAVSVVATQRPNVLMIVVDDLGKYDLSCTGSKLHETPNIDLLASESTSFSQAYVAYPRSVPSRYAMMTGRHCARPQPNSTGDDRFLLDDEYTIAMPFQEDGYNTFMAGKWHLSKSVEATRAKGFDHTVAAGRAGAPQSYFYPFNRKEAVADIMIPPTPDAKENEHLSDYLTRKTAEYIHSVAGDEKPFFALCSFYAVHAPFQAKQDKAARYAEKIEQMGLGKDPMVKSEGGEQKTQQDSRLYAAMVESMDEGVGTLIKALKESGEYENTIIIFISDHGGLSNSGTRNRALATTNAPLKAGKGHLYEGGLQVPLFVRMPEQTKSKIVDEPVISFDIMPTLVDLCELKVPSEVAFDGVSLRSAIEKGSQSKLFKRDLFWHKASERVAATGDFISSAIRSGEYKLIDFYGQGRVELYNLADDIGETTNLIESEPKKAAELQAKLNGWKEEIGAIVGKPSAEGLNLMK